VIFYQRDQSIDEDYEIASTLVFHENEWVRIRAFAALGELGKSKAYRDKVIQLLLDSSIDGSPKVADAFCEVFRSTISTQPN